MSELKYRLVIEMPNKNIANMMLEYSKTTGYEARVESYNPDVSCSMTKEALLKLNHHKISHGIKSHSDAIEIMIKAHTWIKLNRPDVEL